MAQRPPPGAPRRVTTGASTNRGSARAPSPSRGRQRLAGMERRATDPSIVLLLLRAFLGFTFVFAGLQKLANPNFFRAASPISIHAQLVAAGHSSPIKGLIHQLVSVSTPLGLVIALAEVAIGLGVLAGVLTRVAALGGVVLAFGLFLTVSFHSSPYYTGADIVFVFAFTPFVIAGAGRFNAVEAVRWVAQRYQARSLDVLAVDERRRRLIVTGSLGALGLVVAGLAAGLGRLAAGTQPPRSGPSLSAGDSTPTTVRSSPSTRATTSSGTTAATSPGGSPKGTRIGPASGVPVGGAASFKDPGSGDPAIVIQDKAGHFVAFDAVCPHAGCTVGYSSSQKLIVCPCHGSVFSPATGAVEQGPAPRGLRAIAISKAPDGQLFAT
ncbi:MAG: Rieske 2Fe-2S domain-containing protein [Acidimicrobiaceae bacterium]|nr:Rieske 2Fe-2S domain-containing protein [Acidimicrobiaceae bacterium]